MFITGVKSNVSMNVIYNWFEYTCTYVFCIKGIFVKNIVSCNAILPRKKGYSRVFHFLGNGGHDDVKIDVVNTINWTVGVRRTLDFCNPKSSDLLSSFL